MTGTGMTTTLSDFRRRRLQKMKDRVSTSREDYPQRADFATGLDWVNSITAPIIRDYAECLAIVMHNYMSKTATAIMFKNWKHATLPVPLENPTMGYVTFTPAGEEWYRQYNEPYFAQQMEAQALGQRILNSFNKSLFHYLNTILERHTTTTAFDHWRAAVPRPPQKLQRPTALTEPLLGYGYGKDPGKDLPRQAADLARF
jgi:hypothetical protein